MRAMSLSVIGMGRRQVTSSRRAVTVFRTPPFLDSVLAAVRPSAARQFVTKWQQIPCLAGTL
jgi:hypothetical protein